MEETPFPHPPSLVPITMENKTDTPVMTKTQNSLTSASSQVTMVANEATPTSNTPPITTISANALVEILNSVASAVNNTELVVGGVDQASSATPPLQLQFHVSSHNDLSEDNETKRKGKSNGRGHKNKGKEKQPWHYHLGGVRHCRVPLTPEIKEALEVAYVSRIMSKNYRKEGQPEKERISKLTGLDIDKVQEWFKNRRKKDKLITSRVDCQGTPKGKRGRKLLLPHATTHEIVTREEQTLSSQALVEP